MERESFDNVYVISAYLELYDGAKNCCKNHCHICFSFLGISFKTLSLS